MSLPTYHGDEVEIKSRLIRLCSTLMNANHTPTQGHRQDITFHNAELRIGTRFRNGGGVEEVKGGKIKGKRRSIG